MRWLRIKAVAIRHLTEMRHTPSRANDILVWPLIDTLLFGSIGAFLSKAATGSISVSFVLSGLFLYHVVYQTAVALSIAFMSETGSRNLLNLEATPLRAPDYLAGLILFGLIRAIFGLAVIALLAKTLFSYNVFAGGWGLIPIVAELAIVGISLSFLMLSLQIRLGRSAEQATWPIAVAVPTISGAFYPVAALPGFLQPISRLLPTTHAFEAARSLAAGGGMPWHQLAVTLVGALVMLTIGTALLARSLGAFSRLGLVTRYS